MAGVENAYSPMILFHQPRLAGFSGSSRGGGVLGYSPTGSCLVKRRRPSKRRRFEGRDPLNEGGVGLRDKRSSWLDAPAF